MNLFSSHKLSGLNTHSFVPREVPGTLDTVRETVSVPEVPTCRHPQGERSGAQGPPAQQRRLPRSTVCTSPRSGAYEMRPRWVPSARHLTQSESLKVCQLEAPKSNRSSHSDRGTVSTSEAEPALAWSTTVGTKKSLQRFGSRPSKTWEL